MRLSAATTQMIVIQINFQSAVCNQVPGICSLLQSAVGFDPAVAMLLLSAAAV